MMEQNDLLTDPEVNRLAGNAEVLAMMAGLNLQLVHEEGCYRAYMDGERLYSVASRERLLTCLEIICEECDRAILDSIGLELQARAKADLPPSEKLATGLTPYGDETWEAYRRK